MSKTKKPQLNFTADTTQVFLLELAMSSQERMLYQALRNDPGDEAVRNAYIDFLEEQGRTGSAQTLREEKVPGGYVHEISKYGLFSGSF